LAVVIAAGCCAGQAVTSEVSPPDLQAQQISLLPPVLWDEVPPGTSFGDVVVQPLSTYEPGQAVEAVFRWEVAVWQVHGPEHHPCRLGVGGRGPGASWTCRLCRCSHGNMQQSTSLCVWTDWSDPRAAHISILHKRKLEVANLTRCPH